VELTSSTSKRGEANFLKKKEKKSGGRFSPRRGKGIYESYGFFRGERRRTRFSVEENGKNRFSSTRKRQGGGDK